MSSEIAIQVESLSKCYQIYDEPRDRLKQFLFPKLQRLTNSQQKNYFQNFWALNDINFEVKRGEAVGIVGRNGSGKSTLLQIITGTLAPTQGNVRTSGRIAALLELGSGFNPEFTGRENIYLNGSLLGLTRSQLDERFDAIASFADIGDHLNQPVKTYSSGMLVRLAFAVQVQVEPDILIVDEALAVGDWLFQKRCFQQIEKLVSNGTTLLFVSHDQESVRTLTNRALLLNHGRTAAWGKSSDVVLEYRKLLYEEEARYFGSLVPVVHSSGDPASEPQGEGQDPERAEQPTTTESKRSGQLSFGEGHVRIVGVSTLDAQGASCAIFYPGDELHIKVHCRTFDKAKGINVAIRLRNKEGVKVYSWGTLNQDMRYRAEGNEDEIFWEKEFAAGEDVYVDFRCNCPLGMNLYEVQAAVSYEETPDYMGQVLLHWVDEAAFFQVLMRRDEYFFGGVADLGMKALWD